MARKSGKNTVTSYYQHLQGSGICFLPRSSSFSALSFHPQRPSKAQSLSQLMWFLPSLLSKSRHDSARCLSRCLPLRLGAALLTPTEPKRFHWNIHVLEVMHSLKCLTELRPWFSYVPWETIHQVPCWGTQQSSCCSHQDIPCSKTQHLAPSQSMRSMLWHLLC